MHRFNSRRSSIYKLCSRNNSEITSYLSFVKVSAKLKEEKEQHKLRGKKKTKQRDSSPQDENREQLFDVPPKKTNGVKEKSKKAGGEESDDLK